VLRQGISAISTADNERRPDTSRPNMRRCRRESVSGVLLLMMHSSNLSGLLLYIWCKAGLVRSSSVPLTAVCITISTGVTNVFHLSVGHCGELMVKNEELTPMFEQPPGSPRRWPRRSTATFWDVAPETPRRYRWRRRNWLVASAPGGCEQLSDGQRMRKGYRFDQSFPVSDHKFELTMLKRPRGLLR
jgi:hypothetical protein